VLHWLVFLLCRESCIQHPSFSFRHYGKHIRKLILLILWLRNDGQFAVSKSYFPFALAICRKIAKNRFLAWNALQTWGFKLSFARCPERALSLFTAKVFNLHLTQEKGACKQHHAIHVAWIFLNSFAVLFQFATIFSGHMKNCEPPKKTTSSCNKNLTIIDLYLWKFLKKLTCFKAFQHLTWTL